MSEIIFNDYFARTRLDPASADDAVRISRILSRYDMLGVKTLFFTYDFNPSTSVNIHIEKRNNFKRHLLSAKMSRVRPEVVSVVPLIRGISSITGLDRLTIARGNTRFIFIRIAPLTDPDTLIAELRPIIYIKKYIPVITGIEKAVLSISERAAFSLYNIPRAVYQIDLGSLTSKITRELINQLTMTGKTVVFGSGDKFDVCPYDNFEYYIKLLSRVISTESLGYFTLLHNRVFL